MQSINQYAKLWNDKPTPKDTPKVQDEPKAVQRTASIMEFQKLYRKFSIRSVESARYAAVCYHIIYKMDQNINENPKEAMRYLRYLEHIVRDRADDPSGTFICKLQEYREVLSQFSPKTDKKNKCKELQQALSAFESGDYEILEQLRKPRLLDGRQVVDIELHAMVETMISLWGKDYDQLTPAQALQFYGIDRIRLYVNGRLHKTSTSLVQLFLENQADTEEEGYRAVSAWMKEKYAGDDAALAESRNEIGPILTHASRECKKYYALMRGDHRPSGFSESEWEELKKDISLNGMGVGYELLLALRCFHYDPKALAGLSERYPYDLEIQDSLDDLNVRHPDWKTNPVKYRNDKLHAWHMECLSAQRRYAAQYAKPQQQQQISHEYPTAQEYTTPQPVQQQTSYQEYTTPQPVQQQTSYQEASLRSSYQDGYNSVQQSKKIQQDQPNKGEKPCCVVF